MTTPPPTFRDRPISPVLPSLGLLAGAVEESLLEHPRTPAQAPTPVRARIDTLLKSLRTVTSETTSEIFAAPATMRGAHGPCTKVEPTWLFLSRSRNSA